MSLLSGPPVRSLVIPKAVGVLGSSSALPNSRSRRGASLQTKTVSRGQRQSRTPRRHDTRHRGGGRGHNQHLVCRRGTSAAFLIFRLVTKRVCTTVRTKNRLLALRSLLRGLLYWGRATSVLFSSPPQHPHRSRRYTSSEHKLHQSSMCFVPDIRLLVIQRCEGS